MNSIRWIRSRALALFGGAAREREMNDEMRAHLERATERLMARGMSAADAAVEARREFGNRTAIEEDARDARGTRVLEALVADVRFAFRHFARRPATTAIIVAVLSLGIGVNSALFSILQGFLMRPAPAVPDIDEHVRIHGLEQARRGAQFRSRAFTQAEVAALAARSETFESVAAWTGLDVVANPRNSLGARGLIAHFVTPSFWSTVGVSVLGPGFSNAGDKPDFAVVLSHQIAEDWFETPEAAVGRAFEINDVTVRVVGVAPKLFQGAIPHNPRPSVWLPVSARADIGRAQRSLAEPAFSVFGRLAPSTTIERATVVARDVAAHGEPDSAVLAGAVRTASVNKMRGAPPEVTPDDGAIVVAAFGSVALLILVVACTNVSSLMVASAVSRRHEIAVRLSMGASRTRVLRQLLTESGLLGVAGGALGLLFFWWLIVSVGAMTSAQAVNIAPDVVTLLFTLLFAVGTGMLFGLSPALHATRDGVAAALRDSGTGHTGRSRLQRGFVVMQIALSQPLLVLLTALLFVAWAGVAGRLSEPSRERVISARFRAPMEVGRRGRNPIVDTLLTRILEQPGVEAIVHEPARYQVRVVAPEDSVTAGRDYRFTRVNLEGTEPGYFSLLDIPIVLGRDVSLDDTAASVPMVVIAADVAREWWGDASPIGRILLSTDWKAGPRDTTRMMVVGVFEVSHATTRGEGPRLYTAHRSMWRRESLLIRTRGPADAFVAQLNALVRSSSPNLPVSRIETLASVGRRDREEALQIVGAVAAAGGLALLLACIGLYGVVSLAVGQRTREIGIRMALGGKPLFIAGTFLVSGVRLSVVGLLIGLPISTVGFKYLMTGGIIIMPAINMPLLATGIALVMTSVAAAASWLPARRAATVNPSIALRAD